MRNPILTEKAFETAAGKESIEINGGYSSIPMTDSNVMTLNGTINKSLLSLCFLILAACWTYTDGIAVYQNPITFYCVLGVCFVLGLIVAFVPKSAPYLTVPYALLEGSMLGFLSKLAEAQFQGIVLEAVGITITLFLVAFMLFKLEIIKVTEKLRWCIVSATAAIALFYIFEFILFLFGIRIGIFHDSSLLSIGISVFVCIVATFNLFLDFDLIEKSSESRNQGKYMEWYCAFGLMVTLIWIYLEVLRLLSKLKKR